MPAGAGLPSAASAGTPTPPSDFSRGFKAGLAGGGSVLPPPVAPPPAEPSSSTAGAYGVASVGGAQSVPAGGGPVAQSAPAASAGGSAPPGGPVGTPMVSPALAPGGLLPPFNSDIAPRQVSAASASSAPPGTPQPRRRRLRVGREHRCLPEWWRREVRRLLRVRWRERNRPRLIRCWPTRARWWRS